MTGISAGNGPKSRIQSPLTISDGQKPPGERKIRDSRRYKFLYYLQRQPCYKHDLPVFLELLYPTSLGHMLNTHRHRCPPRCHCPPDPVTLPHHRVIARGHYYNRFSFAFFRAQALVVIAVSELAVKRIQVIFQVMVIFAMYSLCPGRSMLSPILE